MHSLYWSKTKYPKNFITAQKRWQRLYHSEKLAVVTEGIKFINGIEENPNAA
jgi:hypothetical protein